MIETVCQENVKPKRDLSKNMYSKSIYSDNHGTKYRP